MKFFDSVANREGEKYFNLGLAMDAGPSYCTINESARQGA